MKKRILLSFLALILVFGLAAVLLTAGIVKSVARQQLSQDIAEESRLIAQSIQGEDPLVVLQNLVSTSRVTLISEAGEVLFDNWADQPLGSHIDRPEIVEALATGFGNAIRYSETTRSTAVYGATRLEDGSILRVAAPERLARKIARDVAPWLVFGLVLVVLLLFLLVNILGKKLVAPILAIDLDKPEDAVVYDEVLPLIRRIDQQNRNNRAQMEALEARRQELDTLLDGMHEGFLALNSKDEITHINPRACAMLGVTPGKAKGRLISEINRSPAMLRLLEDLRLHGTAGGVLEKDGRSYVLFANLIEGRQDGVLLLSDQTEKLEGEAMRKRFTANVSHELRTPLTTIQGYAELLDNQMVKEEDKAGFYRVIHRESRRMLALVEDILRLSRLDEGDTNGGMKVVNLHEIAVNACQQLEHAANARGVSLHMTGEEALVLGNATLLGELCTNLVDNAIKYNVDKGSVIVRVTSGPHPQIEVADTGIGIEAQHQSRVFERFYRTDKSRSQATGGTGLGLSIVKHAAEFHKATITLKSQPGRGTTITVDFPALVHNDITERAQP